MLDHPLPENAVDERESIGTRPASWMPISRLGWQLPESMIEARPDWISPWKGPTDDPGSGAGVVIDVGPLGRSRALFKPNKTILTCHTGPGFNLIDQKIFNCLSLYAQNAGAPQTGPASFRIRTSALRRDLGLSPNADNRQIRDAMERLSTRLVIFPSIQHETGEAMAGTLVERFRMERGEGVLEWSFPPDLAPNPPNSNLERPVEYYARLDFDVCCRFRSKYALQLYELLCTLAKLRNRKKKISVEALRFLIGASSIDGCSLSHWHDFYKRALIPAIEQVNQLAGLSVTMTVVKSPITKSAASIRFELPKK